MNERPDPDALLAAVQKQEARRRRGKLKVFFGMAAGVGKTYAMLEAGLARHAEGVDVVVGYVETHGRQETDALAGKLPAVPRRHLEYRGTAFEEMDLDAVLAREPELVLVDELAHTNAPGSRHTKRYQDILELLDAGIDVYTTINVQHLESRADAVRQITNAPVHETVPDSVLEAADEIKLIDIDPAELRQRLLSGKVYTLERAEVAAQNFFRPGNLTALREMALRFTAEQVDHQLQDYMQVKHIAGPWNAGERLMVAVSSSPLSERLVRWTRRMAYNLEAPWLAVYVDDMQPQTSERQAQLARNLDLARELGAEVVTTAGADIAEALLHIARQRNVSQIVAGKPTLPFWAELLRGGSVVYHLVQGSGDIDVAVVTGDPGPRLVRLGLSFSPRSNRGQYAAALLAVFGAVAVNLWLAQFVGYRAVALILLFLVAVLGGVVGRGPTLVAATASALLWDFLFIPPPFSFSINEFEDLLLLGLYFCFAMISGQLTSRLRAQQLALRSREERASTLYALARDMAQADSRDTIVQLAVGRIRQVFSADVVVLLAGPAHRLEPVPHPSSTFALDEKERSVAAWVFERGKPAGRYTDTLPMAEGHYVPLQTQSGSVGVLGLRWREPVRLTIDQEHLLQTFANQMAVTIQRENLNQAAEQAALLVESERLFQTLLNSVSHELRTPIAAIMGASSSLLDERTPLSAEARQALLQDIHSGGERLHRLVENLLDMSRLESGMLRLRREWCDVSDLVSVSLQRVRPELAHHELIVDVAPNLPLVEMDFVLMEQALVNVLHNAALYTPPGTRIRVMAQTDGNSLVLLVADRGPGLPAESASRVFEKFYRAPSVTATGTGLGLSIARGIVEAHGGEIAAENRSHGGARFTMRLPLGAPPDSPLVGPEEEVG